MRGRLGNGGVSLPRDWRTVIVYGEEPWDYPFRPAFGQPRVWYQEIVGREVARNLARMLACEGIHGVVRRGRPRDFGLTVPGGRG